MDDCAALPLKRLELRGSADAGLWLAGPCDSGQVPERWRTLLSADEEERANRFLRAGDRALFSMARAMLRHLLSEATGIAAKSIAFCEGPFGKPFLAGARGPHFNVSHSGAFALIGLSGSREIGVDIERMRDMGDAHLLAVRYFSDAEYSFLRGLEGEALLTAFYRIWTCKEAVLKALGAGIAEHLKDFSVELTGDGYAIHPESSCFSPALAPVRAEPVLVPPGYAGCCAFA
ncbi:MAG: 4'-phosphopantetheinyl transferase superfamily protein [Beijerinckiaceae bacterium]|nr:4'-phosphopantetheinyl transferase superfamily protein [Beijerinckiaceae bacterium]